MPDCPQCSTLFQQTRVLRKNIFAEELQMIALSQEVSSCLCLDQLTVEVDWILDRLVLNGKNLDSLHDLIQEEFTQNVVRDSTGAFLSGETEIDAILHDKEAFLPL